MFTGIVDHQGQIAAIESLPNAIRLVVACKFVDFDLGESIAIDGACLTVITAQLKQFTCELSPETLDLTIAQHYQLGSNVNLERAMRLQDRVGGHLVSGHVDQTFQVTQIEVMDDFINFRFSADNAAQRLLIAKGSITVNGVSLTINVVHPDGFSVMLIPHTLSVTNLSELKVGDWVNIEYDQVAKIIAKQVEVLTHE